MKKAIFSILFAIKLSCGFASAFYASPSGSASGTGSISNPWDIQTAFNQPLNLLPGDTLYLRGGIYSGNFTSNLNGVAGNYIVVKQFPGERATIADNRQYASGATLQVNGAWTSFEDFEVTNFTTNRSSTSSSSFRPMGIQAQGAHTRFIHLVIHDTGHGIGFWKEATDSEIYGCIIYNCGTQNSIGNYITHGHGIYTQNDSGIKTIRDNVIFNQFGFGIHCYPNPGHVQGFVIEGNTVFHNGILTDTAFRLNNFLIQTYPPYNADNIQIRKNHTYDEMTSYAHTALYDSDLLAGDVSGTYGKIIIDSNYFAGNGRAGIILLNWDSAVVVSNTSFYREGSAAVIIPSSSSVSAYQWNSNTYYGTISGSQFVFQTNMPAPFSSWVSQSGFDSGSSYTNTAPSGTQIFQQPDQYSSGQSFITIYNWDMLPAVPFYPSGLADGDAFEIIDVQDYYGTPVYSGIYNSLSPVINLPLVNTTVSAPAGWPTPAHTSELFNCYLLRKTGLNAIHNSETVSANIRSFPNPANDELIITGIENDAEAILISDISGRTIFSFVPGNCENGTYRLDLSSFSPGMYQIRVQTKSAAASTSFTVAR